MGTSKSVGEGLRRKREDREEREMGGTGHRGRGDWRRSEVGIQTNTSFRTASSC